MKWFKLSIIVLATVIFSGCNPFNKNSKSGLQVITDGVESAVFLDGQYLEKAPFINREIKPGQYVLKIQPDNPTLVAHETTINLRPGLLTVVTWKLASRPELSGGVIYEMEPIKSKSKSEVSFITIPDGAIIALQGRDKEFSPVIIQDANPGHNEFEISLPSYESQKHTINVVAGYRMLVSVKLAKVSFEESQEEVGDIEDSTESNSINLEVKNNETAESAKTTNIPVRSQKTEQQVLISPTNFFQDDKEVLRVRDEAKSSGKELGFATVGMEYNYLENTKDNWLNITFDGKPGWVSGTYAKIITSADK